MDQRSEGGGNCMSEAFDRAMEARSRMLAKKFGSVEKSEVIKHLDQIRHHLYRAHDYLEFLYRDSQMCNWCNYESSVSELRDEIDQLLVILQPGVRYMTDQNILPDLEKDKD